MAAEEYADNKSEQDQPVKRRASRKGFIFIAVALAVILLTILTEKKSTIIWIDDYEEGLKTAKEQKRPLLITFVHDHWNFKEAMKEKDRSKLFRVMPNWSSFRLWLGKKYDCRSVR